MSRSPFRALLAPLLFASTAALVEDGPPMARVCRGFRAPRRARARTIVGTNAPAPSLDELIALDDAISRALRRVPAYESISEAAARVLASPKGDPAWRVAAAILREGSSPWARMRRAARAARRLERVR